MIQSKYTKFVFGNQLGFFICLSTLLMLGVCLYTGNIWEDFFITFKFSRNLCEGHGLVYTPGTRVHGFTSPLGVLLPALCYFVTGNHSYSSALWLFRIIFCIPAFIAGGIFIIKILTDLKKEARFAGILVGIFYLLEAKSVLFSINGMETAFMLFFLAWTLYIILQDFTKKWVLCGALWGGLMWTRPDSCVYIAILIIVTLIMNRANPFKTNLLAFLKAAGITTIIYLPWFVWAWIYYGSPVPHTIKAKGAVLSNSGSTEIISKTLSSLPHISATVFAPPYPDFSCWPPLVKLFCYSLGIFVLIYWIIPGIKDSVGKTTSLIFFFLCLYLAFMPYPYPWYFPPVAMFGLITLVSAFYSLKNLPVGKQALTFQAPFLLIPIGLIMVIVFIMVIYQIKIQQQVIEYETRMQIGKWLKERIKKEDRIYLECLGYIGYFSEGKMLDYPGLSTPEVVKLVKEENLNFVTMISKLKPEWIVIRYYEFFRFKQLDFFKQNYVLVKEFNSLDFSNRYRYIPGEKNLYFDAIFLVFRKKKADI